MPLPDAPVGSEALEERKQAVGQRILVIEDSAVIRRLIEVCLRAADLDIHMSEDGPSGLEAVRTQSPDLLVLDIGLPGMDGWQVLDHIRTDPATRSLPVVVLTAHAEEESRRRADEGGADAFVTKPFQPNDFRQTVLDLLA
jgi:CheY-like chemotaxis protein